MHQRFAVVGNPIDHSLSPLIHQHFASQNDINLTYQKIIAENYSFAQTVTDFFSQKGKGLNITLPFKQDAYILAQIHTERCQKAGAANTLWMQQEKLCADNTDGIGLVRDLQRYVDLQGMRILILGAGGAARGIIAPLLEQKPACLMLANRTAAKLPELQRTFTAIHCASLHKLQGVFDLVINATSVGFANELLALPDALFSRKPFCYDLSYKQNGTTAFVAYAHDAGCNAVDGLGMLVEQAAEAFFIWHGIMPETLALLAQLRFKQRNL